MKHAISATTMFGVAILAATAVADGTTILDGGWRLSVGAAYDLSVKANARVAPRMPYAGAVMDSAAAQRIIDAAKEAGWGKETTGIGGGMTRREFATGAWTDSYDPGSTEQPGYSPYYRFPAATQVGSSRTFQLGSGSYDVIDAEIPAVGSQDRVMSDDRGVLGINVELSRELYRDEENHWGVEAAFDFIYFRHNGLLSFVTSWLNGSSVHRTGTYSTEIDVPESDVSDTAFDWGWHTDGGGRYFGAGSYEGWGAPLDMSTMRQLGPNEISRASSSYGAMRAEGDYENIEMILMARPYYDVCSWLRVNAMLGVAVSRQELDFAMTILRDGALDYHGHHSFSQWDVYGIAGAGLSLRYKDFALSADFLARFLDDDLSFDDRYVRGEVERGRCMFKLSLGYEF